MSNPTIKWTRGAGTGAWATAGNWDLNRVPQANDNITAAAIAAPTSGPASSLTVSSIDFRLLTSLWTSTGNLVVSGGTLLIGNIAVSGNIWLGDASAASSCIVWNTASNGPMNNAILNGNSETDGSMETNGCIFNDNSCCAGGTFTGAFIWNSTNASGISNDGLNGLDLSGVTSFLVNTNLLLKVNDADNNPSTLAPKMSVASGVAITLDNNGGQQMKIGPFSVPLRGRNI